MLAASAADAGAAQKIVGARDGHLTIFRKIAHFSEGPKLYSHMPVELPTFPKRHQFYALFFERFL